MKKQTFLIFTIWLLAGFLSSNFSAALAAQSEKNLPSSGIELQGISYDKKNPEESIAIINGGFFKKGDLYRGFTILEVTPTTVIFEDLKGQQSKSLFTIGKFQPATTIREALQKVSNNANSKNETVKKATTPAPSTAQASSGGGDIYGFHALKKARSSLAEVNNQITKES